MYPRYPWFRWLLALSLILLLAAILFASAIGFTVLSPARIVKIFLSGLTGRAVNSADYIIIWEVRLPRVFLAGLVGASLALAGSLLQVVLENPLADPYLLGVSAGAGMGAAIVMLTKTISRSIWGIPLGAFCGAILSVMLVYFLSRQQGILSSLRLILYGVAIGSMLTAILSFLLLKNHQKTINVFYWMLGSVSGKGWQAVVLLFLTYVFAWRYVSRQAIKLNAMLLGEENSYHLGIDVFQLKKRLLWCSSVLTAAAVAYSGLIPFVGLIVPHACRLLIGADHRRLLLLTPILGAILLISCDTVARVFFLPGEIPVGIITSLIGGPVFVFLLSREGKNC